SEQTLASLEITPPAPRTDAERARFGSRLVAGTIFLHAGDSPLATGCRRSRLARSAQPALFQTEGLILRGWVMAQEGEFNGGVTLMRQSAKERLALGVGWYQIRYLCMLATTYLQQRAAEDGLRVIAEAKDLVARDDEHMWEAELKRVEGELGRVQG